MEVGLRLLVTVETVFDGGFVASYMNPNDSKDVFRGALLQTPQPSSQGTFEYEPSAELVTPESNLANPVGVLHDHPYTDYIHRAEAIVKSVPKQLLLHWNSVGTDPRRGDNLASTGFGVLSRQLSHDQKNCKETPVVLCDQALIPSSMPAMHLFPYNDEQGRCVRRAKAIAKLNLEATFDRMNQTTHSFLKQYEMGSTDRDRNSCKTSKKKNQLPVESKSESLHRKSHPSPLATLQSKRVLFGRVSPTSSGMCPSDLAAPPLANPAVLRIDEAKTMANTIDKSFPTTTFITSSVPVSHHEVNLSFRSSDTGSVGSASGQVVIDSEDSMSCSSSVSPADSHSHPRSALTSSKHISERKRVRKSLKSCTVDVVRCKKSASSSPVQPT